MRTPIFYGSVYGIIRNEKGEVLFAKRGEKANGYNGRFQIPAGHIDGNEKVSDALIREMKEVLDIDVTKFDLVHTAYRIFDDNKEYIDFYFEIPSFNGVIKIGEPDKCSELVYQKLDRVNEINLLKHDELALLNIQENIRFSELFLKNNEY